MRRTTRRKIEREKEKREKTEERRERGRENVSFFYAETSEDRNITGMGGSVKKRGDGRGLDEKTNLPQSPWIGR